MLDELWTNVMAASFWLPVLGQVAGDLSGRVAAASLRAVAVGIVAAPVQHRLAKRGVPRLMRCIANLVWADDRRHPKRKPRRPLRRIKRRVTKTKPPARKR